MSSGIGVEELAAMVRGAVQQVRGGEKHLSELDSACGDGDHGMTMRRAADSMERALSNRNGKDLPNVLYELGWALLGIDGGATGPLLGTFFLGMSEAAAGKQHLDAPGLAQVFQSGLDSVQKHTPARTGDKTMIDALTPAVLALKTDSSEGKSIGDALRDAASSAEKGAASTQALVARFGKAKFSAERSLGHQDAGATSVALMFRGFYQGFLNSTNV